MRSVSSFAAIGFVLALTCGLTLRAEDLVAPTEISVAGGKVKIEVPGGWEKQEPRSRIIEFEFEIPPVKGDANGRFTVMGAGGSVKANLDRWQGQFVNAADKPKITETKQANMTVHLFEMEGTYKDQAGPFAPAVQKENYKMMAAILETKQYGLIFLKAYGPRETLSKSDEVFKKMIETIQVE